MCAAPGSKTAQLIESLHADENVTEPGNQDSLILPPYLLDAHWLTRKQLLSLGL